MKKLNDICKLFNNCECCIIANFAVNCGMTTTDCEEIYKAMINYLLDEEE